VFGTTFYKTNGALLEINISIKKRTNNIFFAYLRDFDPSIGNNLRSIVRFPFRLYAPIVSRTETILVFF